MKKILSINVGLPAQVILSGKGETRTAINKKPVKGKVFLDSKGLAGDGVADSVRHGGWDQAICAYSSDHFSFWENEIPKEFTPGSFGENFTFEGLTEKDISIGDIIQVGEAELQCSQPRQPCYKLVKLMKYPSMSKRIHETGFSGFYLRVIKTGYVEAGSEAKIIHKDPSGFTVDRVNKLMYLDKNNNEKMRELVQVGTLSSVWRDLFLKRLASNNEGLPQDIKV
ncbi:MAG: MOSC domain-containing protein [Nitrospinales bacterium]